MKVNMNAVGVLLLAGMLAMAGTPAQAQAQKNTLALSKSPAVTQTTKGTVAPKATAVPVRRETLSGIDLFPENIKSDVFLLSFQQDMTENGVLEVTNYAKKVLYTQPIPAGDHTLAPPINLGKLRPGTYLVEVKTPTTVYWKKMRVRLK